MKGGKMRLAMVALEDESGQAVELRESFLLCPTWLGPFLHLGTCFVEVGKLKEKLELWVDSWVVQQRTSQNSKVDGSFMEGQLEEKNARAVTMDFAGLRHLTADRCEQALQGQFNRVDFLYRSTIVWKMAEQK